MRDSGVEEVVVFLVACFVHFVFVSLVVVALLVVGILVGVRVYERAVQVGRDEGEVEQGRVEEVGVDWI